MKRFAAAWRFLTIFPFPLPAGPDEARLLRHSAATFPLVGVVLGGIAWCIASGAAMVLPPGAAAVVTVGALAVFSMGFHLDGFADCADAFLSPGRDRDTALAIMKDSRIGAHGAMALTLLLLLKVACLACLDGPGMAAVAASMPVIGRCSIVLLMNLPSARESGLGKLFETRNTWLLFAWTLLVGAVVLFMCLTIRPACMGMGLWLVAALLWRWFVKRRLGGVTGDCYGAACEIGESVAAVAGAASVGGLLGS